MVISFWLELCPIELKYSRVSTRYFTDLPPAERIFPTVDDFCEFESSGVRVVSATEPVLAHDFLSLESIPAEVSEDTDKRVVIVH